MLLATPKLRPERGKGEIKPNEAAPGARGKKKVIFPLEPRKLLKTSKWCKKLNPGNTRKYPVFTQENPTKPSANPAKPKPSDDRPEQ
jgi:hypothetical protein